MLLLRSRPMLPASRLLIPDRTIERVVEDIAERQQPLQLLVFVDDDQSMHPRLADGVKDGAQSVVDCAGVDSREVLSEELEGVHTLRHGTPNLHLPASPTLYPRSS